MPLFWDRIYRAASTKIHFVTTPTNQRALFEKVLKLGFGIAKQLSAELEGFSDPKEMPFHMQAVGETYLRAISFYRAILFLAEKRIFLSEPMALLRALLEDALRLTLIADMDESDRVNAIATWNIDGINRGEGIMVHSAEKLGLGTEETRKEFAEAFAQDRARWERYRTEGSTGKANKVLINSNALREKAKEVGMEKDWWMHDMGDQTIHGSLLARSYARAEGEPGVTTLSAGQEHPSALIDIINHAAHTVVLAHKHTWRMFDLKSESELLQRGLSRITELAVEFE